MSGADTMAAQAADGDAKDAKDARGVVVLGAGDLPAFCPNPNMPLWNHHPRVFLDLSHTGNAACPYCGTRYRLADGVKSGGH